MQGEGGGQVCTQRGFCHACTFCWARWRGLGGHSGDTAGTRATPTGVAPCFFFLHPTAVTVQTKLAAPASQSIH